MFNMYISTSLFNIYKTTNKIKEFFPINLFKQGSNMKSDWAFSSIYRIAKSYCETKEIIPCMRSKFLHLNSRWRSNKS